MILRTLAVTFLCAVMSAASVAQPADTADPPAPDEAARALFVEGENLYAEGRYEEAAAKYEEAYGLSARPLLLFNIANAYERLGEYSKAADALRRYLPDAKAEETTLLRKRIARLDERADARDREQKELAVLRARDCPTCPVVPPVRAKKAGRGKSYATLGLGVVAVTTGIVFGVVARDAHADAQDECRDGGLCPSSAQSDIDRERRFSLLADVSVGVGIIAIASGVYMTMRANAHDRERARGRTVVAPTGGANWAGVGVAGSF